MTVGISRCYNYLDYNIVGCILQLQIGQLFSTIQSARVDKTEQSVGWLHFWEPFLLRCNREHILLAYSVHIISTYILWTFLCTLQYCVSCASRFTVYTEDVIFIRLLTMSKHHFNKDIRYEICRDWNSHTATSLDLIVWGWRYKFVVVLINC